MAVFESPILPIPAMVFPPIAPVSATAQRALGPSSAKEGA